MVQYIIVKVNIDEEMNLRYEKFGELVLCENCKYYNRKIGFCWAKDEYYLPSDYCSDGE